MEALLQRSRLKESQSTSFQLQRISGSQQTHQHRRWKPFFKSCAWMSRFDELSNIREVHATIYMIITSSLHRVLRSHGELSFASRAAEPCCCVVSPPLMSAFRPPQGCFGPTHHPPHNSFWRGVGWGGEGCPKASLGRFKGRH